MPKQKLHWTPRRLVQLELFRTACAHERPQRRAQSKSAHLRPIASVLSKSPHRLKDPTYSDDYEAVERLYSKREAADRADLYTRLEAREMGVDPHYRRRLSAADRFTQSPRKQTESVAGTLIASLSWMRYFTSVCWLGLVGCVAVGGTERPRIEPASNTRQGVLTVQVAPPPTGLTTGTVSEQAATPSWQDINAQSGGFVPTVQLPLLATQGGVPPTVSLQYSAVTADGVLGAGWSLAVGSVIERRGPNGGVPSGGPTDQFFVDGTRLLAAVCPLGGGCTFYPENDPYTTLTQSTDGLGFSVMRQGILREYGALGTARLIGMCEEGVEYVRDSGCAIPTRWALRRVTDAFSQETVYHYTRTSTPVGGSSSVQLSYIDYNQGRTRVRFAYESRPDPSRQSADGVERVRSERLSTVKTATVRGGNEQVVTVYRMHYAQGALDGQSLLERVTEQDASTTTAVTLKQFEYFNPPTEPGLATDWQTLQVSGPGLLPDAADANDDDIHSTQLVDANHDGLLDLLSLNLVCDFEHTPPPGWQWSIIDESVVGVRPEIRCEAKHRVHLAELTAEGPRFVHSRTWSLSLTTSLGSLEAPHFLSDLNGDGYLDIIKGTFLNPLTDCECRPGDHSSIDCNNPSCLEPDYTDEGPEEAVLWGGEGGWTLDATPAATLLGLSPTRGAQLADLDRDGLPDWVSPDRQTVRMNRGSAPYFGAPITLSLADVAGAPTGPAVEKPTGAAECIQRNGSSGLLAPEARKWTMGEGGLPYPPGTHCQGEHWLKVDETGELYDDDSWIARHVTFGDFTGDGIVDRLVGLNWARQSPLTYCYFSPSGRAEVRGGHAAIVRDAAACGSTTGLWAGDGHGGFRFITADIAPGGTDSWASPLERETRRQDRIVDPVLQLSTHQSTSLRHMGTVNLSGASRLSITQYCDGQLRALPLRGLQDYGISRSSTECTVPGATILPGSDQQYDVVLQDLDGDGFDDAVRLEVTGRGISWKRNQRQIAQHRLTAMLGPRGGRTDVQWTQSQRYFADDDSHLFNGTINLPVVSSVTRAGVTTRYVFTEPLTRTGANGVTQQFVAFGRSTAYVEGGEQSELLTASGALVGCAHDDWSCRGEAAWRMSRSLTVNTARRTDGSIRRISLDVPTRTGADLLQAGTPAFNPPIRHCDYDVEEGAFDESDFLVDCRDMPTADGPSVLSTGLPGAPVANVTDYLLWPDSPEYMTRHDRRDPTLADDNSTWTATYVRDAALATNLLTSSVLKYDEAGGGPHTAEHYLYSNFVGTEWTVRTQADGPSGASRMQSRVFVDGRLQEETSVSGQVVSYTYDECGQVRRTAHGGGRWSESIRDALCRVQRESNSSGVSVVYAYDALGRVTLSTRSAVSTTAERLPEEVLRFYYADAAVLNAAAAAVVGLLSDGSMTSMLTYLDADERLLRQSVCRRDDALPLSGTGPVESFAGCAADDAAASAYRVDTVHLYSALSSRRVATVGPFDARDGSLVFDAASAQTTTGPLQGTVPAVQTTGALPISTATFDPEGRPVRSVDPTGVQQSYDYGVNWSEQTQAGVTIRAERIGSTTTLTRRATGQLVVDAVLIGKEVIDPFGQLIEQVDAEQQTTTHSYDGWGRRQGTTGPARRVTTWRDNCQERQAQWVSPRWAWTYTVDDQVETSTDPLGAVTRYTFDSHGRLLDTFGPDGALVERRSYVDGAADADVTLWKMTVCDLLGTRDGNCRIEQMGPFDELEYEVNIDGGRTEYWRDARGPVRQVQLPTGETRQYGYDQMGHLIRETSVRGALQSENRSVYDARGAAIERIDADGVHTRFVQDLSGRLVSVEVGGAGGAPRRKLLDIERDAYGRVRDSTEEGVTTRYHYDGYGRQVAKLVGYDAREAIAALERQLVCYDASDRPVISYNGLGEGSARVYDEAGQLVARQHVTVSSPACPTQPTDLAVLGTERYEYSARGERVWSEDGDGVYLCDSYDAYGRPSERMAEGLGTTRWTYDRNPNLPYAPGGESRSLRVRERAPTGEIVDEYLRGGLAWLVTEASGAHRRMNYSPVTGLLTSTARMSASGIVLAEQPLEYEPASDRVSKRWDWMTTADKTTCLSGGPCPVGAVRYQYTDAGRVRGMLDALGARSEWTLAGDGSGLTQSFAAPAGFVERYIYRPQSTQLQAIERSGTARASAIRTSFERDRNLWLTSVLKVQAAALPAGLSPALPALLPAGTPSWSAQFKYDGAGRRTTGKLYREGSLESETSWSYDEAGRLDTKTLTLAGNVLPMGWTYTPAGRPLTVSYPSGQSVRYDYLLTPGAPVARAGSGLLHQVVLEGAARGRDALLAEFSDYDDAGRNQGTELAYGTAATAPSTYFVEHLYARGQEQTRRMRPSPLAAPTVQEDYTPDALGRPSRVDRLYGTGASEIDVYTLDARGALEQERHTAGGRTRTIDYGYGRGGQRRSMVQNAPRVATSYDYWPGSRIKVPGRSLADTWDAYGRQLVLHSGEELSYGLGDEVRRIRSRVLGSRTDEEMLYDVDGQRVGRRVSGRTHLYVSSDISGQVSYRVGDDGTSTAIVRDPGGGVLALVDHNNVVSPLSSMAEDRMMQYGPLTAPASTQTQSAFGVIQTRGGTSEELGYHQMWATHRALNVAGVRIYDPATGRFTAPDPLLLDAASDPNQSVDLYRYAQNNPLQLQDSTGYASTPRDPVLAVNTAEHRADEQAKRALQQQIDDVREDRHLRRRATRLLRQGLRRIHGELTAEQRKQWRQGIRGVRVRGDWTWRPVIDKYTRWADGLQSPPSMRQVLDWTEELRRGGADAQAGWTQTEEWQDGQRQYSLGVDLPGDEADYLFAHSIQVGPDEDLQEVLMAVLEGSDRVLPSAFSDLVPPKVTELMGQLFCARARLGCALVALGQEQGVLDLENGMAGPVLADAAGLRASVAGVQGLRGIISSRGQPGVSGQWDIKAAKPNRLPAAPKPDLSGAPENTAVFGTNRRREIGSRSTWPRRLIDKLWDAAPPGPNGGKLDIDGKEVFWTAGTSRVGVWDVGHRKLPHSRRFVIDGPNARKRFIARDRENLAVETSTTNQAAGDRNWFENYNRPTQRK